MRDIQPGDHIPGIGYAPTAEDMELFRRKFGFTDPVNTDWRAVKRYLINDLSLELHPKMTILELMALLPSLPDWKEPK